jgi:hypothetical protein
MRRKPDFGAFRRFSAAGLPRCALVRSPLALERRLIAFPKAQDYADTDLLHQGFATSEMGLRAQFALQQS